ncbi:MAG: hypothetical protein AAF628_30665 [Planctomycetota bacterium]
MSGGLWYTLDSDDRICDYGGDWSGPGCDASLEPSQYLKRPLWDLLVGSSCGLFRLLIGHARDSGKELRFEVRCDDEAHRRRLRTTVTPTGGQVRIGCELLAEEAREVKARFMARQREGQGKVLGPPLRMCSFCNRLRVNQSYVELEEALERNVLAAHTSFALIHDLCDECFGRTKALLA